MAGWSRGRKSEKKKKKKKKKKERKKWEGKSDRLGAECAMGKAVGGTACQLFLCKDDVIKCISV